MFPFKFCVCLTLLGNPNRLDRNTNRSSQVLKMDSNLSPAMPNEVQFYVAQHETKRTVPVTVDVLQQAIDSDVSLNHEF